MTSPHPLRVQLADGRDAEVLAAVPAGLYVQIRRLGLMPTTETVPTPPREAPVMSNTATTEVLDLSFAPVQDGYKLTQIVKLPTGERVRIRVLRNTYVHQSHAVAELLTPNAREGWTPIADVPPTTWHSGTPYKVAGEAIVTALAWLAEDLTRRATAILTG